MPIISLSEAQLLQTSRVIPYFQASTSRRVHPDFPVDDSGEVTEYDFSVEEEEDYVEQVDTKSTLIGVSPSQFAETAIRIPEAGRIGDFSFAGREYLRKIYDSPAHKVLMQCGRQVEKCGLEVVKVLTLDGRYIRVAEMKPGERVASLEVLNLAADKYGPEVGEPARPIKTSWRLVGDKVVRIKSAGKKQAFRIISRMGSECEVGRDHPFLTAGGWLCAADLQIGMRVAAVRSIENSCCFGAGTGRPVELLALYGYVLANGGLTSSKPIITKTVPAIMKKISDCLDRLGAPYVPTKNKRGLIVGKDSALYTSLVADKLMGKASAHKFIPEWLIQDATREELITFVKALWCDCDGSVKHSRSNQWNIVYASTSRVLAEQVRAILLKFGIPSHIRRNNHPYYRDNPKRPGIDQHLVRVETIEGIYKFLRTFTEIDPGKYVLGDSNRDTYPLEIVQPLIRTLCTDLGLGLRQGSKVKSPLKAAGLRVTLKYPPSRAKLDTYIEFFDGHGGRDHEALLQLQQILDGDVIWDEVVEIQDLGKQEVFHVETKKYHNYVINGLITHNSTTLGNRLLCYSALANNFKSLYVAPSAEQAKVFSNDRIKDVIDASPMLKSYTTNRFNQAVFFKKFINYSQIRLRYAYLTADRVRGIPADMVLIDELQDILVDNIPVIEQCAFHSPFKLFLYSGTPKSVDNTIEFYWSEFSTQNEWVVPCEKHGAPDKPATWHWNVLGEKNIGRKGLICDRCGSDISARHPKAQWAAMNPKRPENADKVTFEGYRIPQIMVPWVDWEEITVAQEQYSRAQFMNEKLGLAYDSGVRPITRSQLQSCCKDEIRLLDIEAFKRLAQGRAIYAGVDWGSGEHCSFTTISFGGYFGTGNFSIFWIHRFSGQDLDPERQIDLICQMIAQLQVRIVGVDYGGGFYQNDKLIKRFGPHKVMKYQYNPRQKRKIYWEPNLQRWMCHRTEVMSDVFNALKAKKIDLPCWDDFQEPHGVDILNIFTEYNERLRMNEYKKPPGKTDDAFHSLLYCLMASMIEHPRPDIVAHTVEPGIPVHHG